MPDATAYLETAVEAGVLVLTVTRRQIEGEDVASGMKDEMDAAVTRHGTNRVVLDLSRCRYVSSIAFWPLLALRRKLGGQNGRLIICGLTGAVYDVFASTKMVSSSGAAGAPFEMAPDRQAAVARLTDPA
ncbi:MAG: STAS domain-containing protein [Gemmataceae bacterium]